MEATATTSPIEILRRLQLDGYLSIVDSPLRPCGECGESKYAVGGLSGGLRTMEAGEHVECMLCGSAESAGKFGTEWYPVRARRDDRLIGFQCQSCWDGE